MFIPLIKVQLSQPCITTGHANVRARRIFGCQPASVITADILYTNGVHVSTFKTM